MYTYTVKMGDVAKFPNGIEANYSEHDERVVIVVPKGKTLKVRKNGDVWLLEVQS